MVTAFDIAGFPDVQFRFDVSWHLMTSPLAGINEYTGLFVPTLKPLIDHWYAGAVPPLTGVAVKVTEVPWQTGFDEGDMETLTGTLLLTTIVTGLEVAGLPVAQEAFEVSLQVTTSPFTGLYVKTGLLVPYSIPLTFHSYAGEDPPFIGVAVKVTGMFRQEGLAEAIIVTPTGWLGLTVMVIEFELAGLPDEQVALEVN